MGSAVSSGGLDEKWRNVADLAAGDASLSLFLPKDVSEKIDQWRKLCCASQEDVPPHITIAYPPFVPLKDWDAERPVVLRCLASFQPFEVSLQGVGSFSGPPAVLWLRPDDGGNLSRIHSALKEQLPAHVRTQPRDYSPHVTIGFFESPQSLQQAEQILRREIIPLRFRAVRLTYAVLGEGNHWHDLEYLTLGGLPEDPQ